VAFPQEEDLPEKNLKILLADVVTVAPSSYATVDVPQPLRFYSDVGENFRPPQLKLIADPVDPQKKPRHEVYLHSMSSAKTASNC